MDDQVVVDAKRILLRYGAPINVLDDVSDVERVELARIIAKTPLPERERSLRQALADRGYMEPPPPKMRRSRAKPGQPAAGADGSAPAATPAPVVRPSLLRAKPKPPAKPVAKPAPKAAGKPVPAPKPAPAPKAVAKTKPVKAAKPKTKAPAPKAKVAKTPAKPAVKGGAKKKPAATKVKRKK